MKFTDVQINDGKKMDQLVEIMRFELDSLPGGIDDVARKFLDTVCNNEQENNEQEGEK